MTVNTDELVVNLSGNLARFCEVFGPDEDDLAVLRECTRWSIESDVTLSPDVGKVVGVAQLKQSELNEFVVAVHVSVEVATVVDEKSEQPALNILPPWSIASILPAENTNTSIDKLQVRLYLKKVFQAKTREELAERLAFVDLEDLPELIVEHPWQLSRVHRFVVQV